MGIIVPVMLFVLVIPKGSMNHPLKGLKMKAFMIHITFVHVTWFAPAILFVAAILSALVTHKAEAEEAEEAIGIRVSNLLNSYYEIAMISETLTIMNRLIMVIPSDR
jgi:hypothetical protein